MLRKILRIFLFIIVSTSVECTMREQHNTVGIVRNLSVSVFNDNSSQTETGTFKFNISWLPPESGKPPTSYSIMISSIAGQEKENQTLCPQGSLYYTTKDEAEFHVELPEHKFLSDSSQLNVRLKCPYEIEVFGNPRSTFVSNSPKMIFTVPECVGSICSCHELQKYLPIPKIQVQILLNGDILIEWKTNSSHSGIQAYTIRYGELSMVSKNGSPVYKKTKIITLPKTNHSFLWKREINPIHRKSLKELIIFVSTEDVHKCHSEEGSLKIELPTEKSVLRENISVICCLIIICFLIIGTLWCSHKFHDAVLLKKNLSRSKRIDLVLKNRNILYIKQEEEEENGRYDDENLEIDYNRVNIKGELGRGQFGRVYLASLEGEEGAVAIKLSTSESAYVDEARKQLLEEIETIKTAGKHPNLVGLVGYCTAPADPICLILEYVEGGDLLSYLQFLKQTLDTLPNQDDDYIEMSSHNSEIIYSLEHHQFPILPKRNHWNALNFSRTYTNIASLGEGTDEMRSESRYLSRSQLLCFAQQIALGMGHLEKKKIIHRDLAARNILIDANYNLKISDFGLSRNGVYVMGNGLGRTRRLPIRWMAPEAICDRAFSSKSDVWSYAVVLWEIGTLGMFPYPDIPDDKLLNHVLNDTGRLPKPASVESDIYNLMVICWTKKPEHRPFFAELISWLEHLREPCSFTRRNNGRSNPCYSLLSS